MLNANELTGLHQLSIPFQSRELLTQSASSKVIYLSESTPVLSITYDRQVSDTFRSMDPVSDVSMLLKGKLFFHLFYPASAVSQP
jgi:hypothetical protein